MANERTYPCLACADLDASISFYETLGFARTYRQMKPNPYAVVQREDFFVHLFAVDGFDPNTSLGNVIVSVPDPDVLYKAFAEGLRRSYGKLPVKGLPRITRPRKGFGVVYGFSVVDPGGNWLRISKASDEVTKKEPGLAGIVATATRLGDAHGDPALALRTLESGIRRTLDAPPIERARAFLYAAELAIRTGDTARAQAHFAEAQSISLSRADQEAIAAELSDVAELLEV